MSLFLPIIIYALLYLPYLYLVPSNDGSLEYMFAYRWLIGDDRMQLLSLHPPMKLILNSFFMKNFGTASTGYIGLIFGIMGIIALYVIAKKLFDQKVAIISSLLLATSGLFLSVGVFSLHDFLMTVLILIAFAFYLHEKYWYYALFVCFAILTKETAIFFAGSIFLSELIIKRKITITSLLPLLVLGWYIEFLHFSGNHLWNDWNFSPTANRGSFFTMINNVITFKMFNKYAVENWLHLFIFNFNWLYWLFAIISFWYIKTTALKKALLPIGLFFLFFIVMVLSFQTFTINRYTLPLFPFVYLFASVGVTKIKYQFIFIPVLLFVSIISLSQSIDPLSNAIWPKTRMLGENIYLKHVLDGDDGITYNLQYLTMMQARTDMLKKGECSLPNMVMYDKKILSLLHIYSCK